MKTPVVRPLFTVILLILLIASVSAFALALDVNVASAHHMAPNDNSTAIGNINEEMVHNGLVVGGMEETPDIGAGNLNRATEPWMP